MPLCGGVPRGYPIIHPPPKKGVFPDPHLGSIPNKNRPLFGSLGVYKPLRNVPTARRTSRGRAGAWVRCVFGESRASKAFGFFFIPTHHAHYLSLPTRPTTSPLRRCDPTGLYSLHQLRDWYVPPPPPPLSPRPALALSYINDAAACVTCILLKQQLRHAIRDSRETTSWGSSQ